MKIIEGFSNYKIYMNGDVYSSLGKGKSLKPSLNSFGYPVVTIKDDCGKWRMKAIHRLVAEYYIANPNLLPEVNHKDRNRSNYNIENLEWTSKLENSKNRVIFTEYVDKENWAIDYLTSLGYSISK